MNGPEMNGPEMNGPEMNGPEMNGPKPARPLGASEARPRPVRSNRCPDCRADLDAGDGCRCLPFRLVEEWDLARSLNPPPGMGPDGDTGDGWPVAA